MSIRQNYSTECEAALNKQINTVLHASYVYLSMACNFDCDDVALCGFHKFFKASCSKYHDHAEKMIKYQSLRGGKVIFQDIQKTEYDMSDTCPLHALQAALDLEKTINQTYLNLHALTEKHNDAQMSDWLVQTYLSESVERIKKLSCHVTNVKRVGVGLGHYVFDEEELQ